MGFSFEVIVFDVNVEVVVRGDAVSFFLQFGNQTVDFLAGHLLAQLFTDFLALFSGAQQGDACSCGSSCHEC